MVTQCLLYTIKYTSWKMFHFVIKWLHYIHCLNKEVKEKQLLFASKEIYYLFQQDSLNDGFLLQISCTIDAAKDQTYKLTYHDHCLLLQKHVLEIPFNLVWKVEQIVHLRS